MCAQERTFVGKCAGVGVRAGTKIGVRSRAPHIAIFVRCACGCGPKSPHTKGLQECAKKWVAITAGTFLCCIYFSKIKQATINVICSFLYRYSVPYIVMF